LREVFAPLDAALLVAARRYLFTEGGEGASPAPPSVNRYRMSGLQLQHATLTSDAGAFLPHRRRSGLKPALPRTPPT
jgi:hypothetical protein